MEFIGTVLLSWHVNQFKLFSIGIFQLSKLCLKSAILKASKNCFLKDFCAAYFRIQLFVQSMCMKSFILRMPYNLKIPSTNCCQSVGI